MKELQEIEALLSDKNGKVASARCTQQYFTNKKMSHLYEWMMEETKLLPDDYNIMFRLVCLREGVKQLSPCANPECDTGLFSRVIRGENGYEVSSTCSNKCSANSPTARANKSAGRSLVDEDAASEKRKKTMMEVYGVEYSGHRPETKKGISDANKKKYHGINPDGFAKVNDEDWLYQEYVVKTRHAVDIGAELGIDYSTVLERCRKYGFEIRQYSNRSFKEIQVENYIRSLGFDVVVGDRTILSCDREIDIYVPQKKFAIEFDGIHYHSIEHHHQESSQKNKHKNKTIEAAEAGVSLIHIFENEWTERQTIVESIIRARLGLNSKIYAAQCEAVAITNKECAEFLNINHIQKTTGGAHFYGLKYKGELVQVLSMGRPRMNKKYDWELIRSCAKMGLSIVEGASTLFKLFAKEHSGSVICYSDLRYGEGNVYKHLGFTRKEDSVLGYSWTKGNQVVSRWAVNTKEKLASVLGDKYDDTLGENPNMYGNRYRKLFDCGNAVWTIE